ncbi:chemotaxis protein CheW [Hydrogenophaga sp.]|uniref:chemotaxis protein CheW n=1 Tax=Hydrogenophaga sp. TaxID=1904254 RepID=UPI0027161AA1|nr:chemotaxis protein CheW [Hydrogenophaga sp.]MDO9436043.1 chemotaxis protein CheW [Hydrogenophaga sp.]
MPTTSLHADSFLPYMRDVARCEQSLRELGLMWRMVESSAKLNCPLEAQSILPIMSATQAGFNRLERELVRSLIEEKVGNVLTAIGTKARFVIDIVVRNLYERTADVGFLATDRELCAFVAGEQGHADTIRQRLHDYRNKYTVYNEILLLDTRGNVLVQLDPDAPVEGSTDPLIAATLSTDQFVETFRATDLRPGTPQALIYSRRMHHPDTGAVVGLLCLCFDFEREMASIFRSHRDREGRINMLLLDEDRRVIASADDRWIAVGTTVPVNPHGLPQVLIHEGREYLMQTCGAEDYQGYPGPKGWQGQVMVPLAMAFSAAPRQTLATLTPTTSAGLLTHARRFSPPLYEVMTATETIQRVVWNGQVITSERREGQQQLKAILDQISETGTRSNEVFSQSISDLYETVLQSRLDGAESTAQLLVDLLDRNLYERANDCRWWALTPQIRTALASPAPDMEAITCILDVINGLYTVYSTICVYDAQGQVIAASRNALPRYAAAGAQVDGATLRRVKALKDDQSYTVSDFAASALGGDTPTYVYHAAIRHPQDESLVVGGIGIVFETERELQAMLKGCLAPDAPTTAQFVNRQGHVLSSTDSALPTGVAMDLPADALQLRRGESLARVLEHGGDYVVMAIAANEGYREFKTTDGYVEDVLAVVCIPLGKVQPQAAAARSAYQAPPTASLDEPLRMVATVWCGPHILGLPAAQVTEAVPAHKLGGRSTGDTHGRVGLLIPQPGLAIERSVWVYDLGRLLGAGHRTPNDSGEIVVVQRGQRQVGLLVDALHAVPEFADDQIVRSPVLSPDRPALITHLIKPVGDHPLIQLIDAERLFEELDQPALPE